MDGVRSVEVAAVPDPIPEDLHVLDVREAVEWRHGHIDGAQHIPLQEIPARIQEVPEAHTLVVCQIGGRSARAVAYLSARGHNVVNLAGGMIEWAEAGRPMVSETGSPPHVV